MRPMLNNISRRMKKIARRALRNAGYSPKLRFGSFGKLTPVSRSFGLDRGWPINRYYIEKFLAQHALDIKGTTLEAGGLVNYTREFGGSNVTKADVLYPKEGFPDATVIGDLATGIGIPLDNYDCIILTQVYGFIFDLAGAIQNTYQALKPGGVLLATLPGITKIPRYDLEQWGDYWRFTEACAVRLFGNVFGSENVVVAAYGNVLVACSLLQGLAQQDLQPHQLEHNDPDYQVIITVRCVRPERPSPSAES